MHPLFSKNAPGAHSHCFDPRFELSGPIQDLTSPHLASGLPPRALFPRLASSFPSRDRMCGFPGGRWKKNHFEHGRQPFQVYHFGTFRGGPRPPSVRSPEGRGSGQFATNAFSQCRGSWVSPAGSPAANPCSAAVGQSTALLCASARAVSADDCGPCMTRVGGVCPVP